MYTPQTFDIPELDGISSKTIQEHLGLYKGYVTNLNTIRDMMGSPGDFPQDGGEYALKEARRRLAFEFDGMRNHEYYFSLLEGGAQEIKDSALKSKIEDQFNSFDTWIANFQKYIVSMRGVGWAMLGYDAKQDLLLNYWVDEQHFGHLTGVQPILAVDMWEHSYAMDYAPSEKMKYVNAFFGNLNWSVAEKWFDEASR